MKNSITKSILTIATIMAVSIYVILEVGLTVPIFLLILFTNVITILVAGFNIKKTIDNYFKN